MCGGRKPASLGATGGPAAAQTIEEGWRPGCPGMRNMIAAFDRAAVRRIGETDSRLLDLVMPRLSRLANRGLLWIGVASVLQATGDRWRGGRLARPGRSERRHQHPRQEPDGPGP